MKMKNLLPLLVSLAACSGTAWAADNMTFSGNLRAHACTLHPDDAVVEVDFNEIGTRDLYLSGGTPNQPFNIRLLDCNTSVASELLITFDGTRNAEIPGALALESSSEASGVAVVLSDASQRPIALGTALRLPLNSGSNSLQFHRRLQVEPDALRGEGIISGTFSANSTFTLYYP
ncbi:fimbrial protein [Pantoea sp. USHLN256]|uniref:fimbrial protein n=1 Tax=Pantoea sp. USHLN256 TaxID=3081293 RepID=UPI003018DE2C